MTAAGPDDLAVSQARDTAALAREVIGDANGRGKLGPRAREARARLAQASAVGADKPVLDALRIEFLKARAGEDLERAQAELDQLTNEDDAASPYERAVDRLIRLHRPEYRRLLAEERQRTP